MQSLHGLWRIWFDLGSTQQYYPALFSTFWLEHRIWGDAALGYHLTNILLHATSAWLFGLALRRLAIPGARLGALIFALHPVCVESVAWISEQKNTLSTLFYLLAVLAYLRFDKERDRSKAFWWLATLFFVLALLCKTVTATLPAALLVVLWWKRGRLSWREDILPLAPWLGLGVTAGLFTSWVERAYVGARGAAYALDGIQRCLVAGRAIWFYLGKLLWPANLIFIYPHWRVSASEVWQDLCPLGALALIAALWLIRRRTRAPLAALLFYAGSLFPTLGFLNVYPFIYSYVADHWQYLASFGIIALAAGGWGMWVRIAAIRYNSQTGSTPGFGAIMIGIPQFAAVAVVCTLGVLTWRQCRVYYDVETLYRAVLDRNPDCWMAHSNLGASYQADENWPGAVEQFQEALRLNPDDAVMHNNLGEAWLKVPGRLDDAVGQLEEALRLKPNFAEAHHNLALALEQIPGRQPEAITHFEEALRLKPDYAEAHYNLALALAHMSGRLPEAIAQFEQALRFKPDYAEAHEDLAIALEPTPGRLPDAVKHFEEALRLMPNNAEAHVNLAIALEQIPGREPDAVAHYEEAVRLKPDYAEAHNNLAAALAPIPGRLPDAISHFEEAVRLKPDYTEARYNLALVYAKTGRLEEAVRQLQTVLKLNPGLGEARKKLEELNASGGAISDGKPK
jgi:tetratricopeptide (TPR) repeat protein